MTLASFTHIIPIAKTMIQTTTHCERTIDAVQGLLFWEIYWWTLLIISPIIGCIINICSCFCHDVFVAPIYFWKLCRQKNGRSIFAMLRDPSGTNHLELRGRKRQHIHPRQWRRGFRRTKRIHLEQGPDRIIGYDSRLYLHSYYQMDRQNINRCEHGGPRQNSEDSSAEAYEQTMAFTHYYASTFFASVKIIHKTLPKKPPDGHISKLMVLLVMLGIFSMLTFSTAIRIALLPKKRRRRHKRSPEALLRRKIKRAAMRSAKMEKRKDKWKLLPGDESTMPASEGVKHTHSPSEGDSSPPPNQAHKLPNAFTTSLADTDLETLNMQVPFDTDSIFFVCDKSTTGHICNDARIFVPGTLRNTAQRLTTANGT